MDMYGKVLDGKSNLHLGPKLMERMKAITGTLKNGGSILSLVGGTAGYYDDVYNKDKTAGQAIAHNGASFLGSILVGGGAAATAGLFIASGPAGWIGVGAAAVAGYSFNKLYDNNVFGIQSGLDWTGEQIDKGFDWAGKRLGDARDWAGNQMDNAIDDMREAGEGIRDGVQNMADSAGRFVDDVGDAISGGLNAINPF